MTMRKNEAGTKHGLEISHENQGSGRKLGEKMSMADPR
jgi:hypothetical protein